MLIKCSSIIKRGAEYLSKTADYVITTEELRTFIEGWFAVHKIKDRHKSGIKSVKSNLPEESPNISMQSIGSLS